MPFVKTTWAANALPAWDAAQANRIEQGIADAFGTTQALAAVQSFSFAALDGENDYGYEFTFIGRVVGSNASGIDTALLLRPNGDTNTANYTTTEFWRWFQDPIGTFNSGGGAGMSGPSGIWLGGSNWNDAGGLIVRSHILTATGQKRIASGDYTFARANDARRLRAQLYGYWYDTTTPVTHLDFALRQNTTNFPAVDAGVSLTGRAVLRRLTV